MRLVWPKKDAAVDSIENIVLTLLLASFCHQSALSSNRVVNPETHLNVLDLEIAKVEWIYGGFKHTVRAFSLFPSSTSP